MGQVVFDTQEFVETLENAGLPKDQARAISLVVPKFHEVADLMTKRDVDDARKELSSEIAVTRRDLEDVRKDLSAEIVAARKESGSQVAEIRKDMATKFEKTDAKIADARKEAAARADRTDAQIALMHKDIESLTNKLVIKMASTWLA